MRSGIVLIKFWFSVSDAEQGQRSAERIRHPEKRWKLSEMDLESRARWVDYSVAKDVMFEHTDTSPWWVVDADDKRRARLNCIQHLLASVDYRALKTRQLELPPIQEKRYERPPEARQTHVVDHYASGTSP